MESCEHSSKIDPVILFLRQSWSTRVGKIHSRTVMVAVEQNPGEDNSGHMTTQLNHRSIELDTGFNLEKSASRGFAVLLAPDWYYTDAHRGFRPHLIAYFLASVL